MSLYEGLGVETAPIPEITSQDDSTTTTTLSERHTINANANIEPSRDYYLFSFPCKWMLLNTYSAVKKLF